MKKLLFLLMFCLPLTANAEYMDVIEFELKDGCSFGEYLGIVEDFNTEWAPGTGYSSRIAMPLQSNNLTSLYWIGTTENAAAFGTAWDKWRNELNDPDSVAGKLWARFEKCSSNIGRRGYDVY